MRKFGLISKKIARISYIIGSISLVLGIILSFVSVPVSASDGITGDDNPTLGYQPNACTLGFKCEQPGCEPDPYSSWSAPAGYQICEIAIKAGQHYLPFGSDGCADVSPPGGDGIPDYCVSGVGTGFGEAERLCVEDGQTECYAISHSEFYIDVLPPSPTPTDTNVPPSPTPTDTSEPPSPTPTDTSVPPSPTPTDTSVPPSPTPTDTSVPPSPTPTDTSMPPSATPTGTIILPTSTPTGTPIAETVTPTSTPTEQPTNTFTPTATDTNVPPTETPTATILATLTTSTSTPLPTSTSSGEQVTPTATQSGEQTPGTLPPPQPTGTQPSVLIPVTGIDLNSPLTQLDQTQSFLVNLGFALLGVGLIFHGIGRKIEG